METQKFDKNTLLELVKQEAVKLRATATPEELAKLNFKELENSANKCVYGSMTGNCYSKRAVELIEACCQKVYVSYNGYIPRRPLLNGSPVGKNRRQGFIATCEPEVCDYYSPIEVLLGEESDFFNNIRENSNIEKVISYLKSETETLDF